MPRQFISRSCQGVGACRQTIGGHHEAKIRRHI